MYSKHAICIEVFFGGMQIVLESERVLPPSFAAGMRVANDDFELCGYLITKGTCALQ